MQIRTRVRGFGGRARREDPNNTETVPIFEEARTGIAHIDDPILSQPDVRGDVQGLDVDTGTTWPGGGSVPQIYRDLLGMGAHVGHVDVGD